MEELKKKEGEAKVYWAKKNREMKDQYDYSVMMEYE
jgi:hypothetical protein